MKKKLLSLALLTLLFLSMSVYGQSTKMVGETEPSSGDLINILYTIRNWLLTILIIIAGIFIIIAGIDFVTAAGDPGKVEKARNYVLYALIGVAVGALSWVLINFILEKIAGIKGTNSTLSTPGYPT